MSITIGRGVTVERVAGHLTTVERRNGRLRRAVSVPLRDYSLSRRALEWAEICEVYDTPETSIVELYRGVIMWRSLGDDQRYRWTIAMSERGACRCFDWLGGDLAVFVEAVTGIPLSECFCALNEVTSWE